MSGVDRSAEAVAERLRRALRPSSGSHGKGVRMAPEAVRARLREASELRRLALALARGGAGRPPGGG